jgi:hypothetical protein
LNDFVVFCLLFYRVKNIEIYNHDLMCEGTAPHTPKLLHIFQNLIEIKNKQKDKSTQVRGGAEAPVPELSVVLRFRAYSRRHETEPSCIIPPQDFLRPGGRRARWSSQVPTLHTKRRARWLLRDGAVGRAVQRQSAVQHELQKLESWSAALP